MAVVAAAAAAESHVRFTEKDVALHTSFETLAAFAFVDAGVHACADEFHMPCGAPLRMWLFSGADAAVHSRSAMLMKCVPMLFLAFVLSADDATTGASSSVPSIPGVDFFVQQHEVQGLRARCIAALYADALFKLQLTPKCVARPPRVNVFSNDPLFFAVCVQWMERQLVRLGFELSSADDDPDAPPLLIIDVFIGDSRKYARSSRPYMLCVTEQIASGTDHFDSEIFRGALHVVVPSHVLARALRATMPPGAISILPFLWATAVLPMHDMSPPVRRRCLQLGTYNQRRAFAHQRMLEHVPGAEFNTRTYGTDERNALLAGTRVLYNPSYYSEPAFASMHRIAECLSFGIRVVCERSSDVVMERMVAALSDTVFCTYEELTPCTVAAMWRPVRSNDRLPLLDAVLNAPLDSSWFPV